MDREKILLYSEKKENLGKPEHFLGAGEVKEPGMRRLSGNVY